MIAGPLMNFGMALLIFALIYFQLGDNTVIVREIAPNSPAEAVGLKPMDKIVSIAGVDIHNMENIHEVISSNLETEVEFIVERNGEEVSMLVTPRSNPPEGEGAVGFVMEYSADTTPISPLTALVRGFELCGQQVNAILSLPGQLISGAIAPNKAVCLGIKACSMYTTTCRMQTKKSQKQRLKRQRGSILSASWVPSPFLWVC